MTIIEAINKIDNLKPNDYSQPEKIRWLSVVDNLIYNDIVKKHETEESSAHYRKAQLIITSHDESGYHYRLSPDYIGEDLTQDTTPAPTPAPSGFPGYTEETPLDTELIAGAPYDELYVSWLESKIDYYNGEYNKYNNSVTKFNEEYAAFNRYYNRTHMPLQTDIKYF